MNIATDLIERDHEEIEDCVEAFERKPHRSAVLDICTMAERHLAMEEEVLHPVLADIDGAAAQDAQGEHDELKRLVDQARHESDRSALRSSVEELSETLRRHVDAEERDVLPAMEDALGVSRMNELGIELLDWQHEDARRRREDDDSLQELLTLTRAELYEKAQEADLDGRSRMKKFELAEALAES